MLRQINSRRSQSFQFSRDVCSIVGVDYLLVKTQGNVLFHAEEKKTYRVHIAINIWPRRRRHGCRDSLDRRRSSFVAFTLVFRKEMACCGVPSVIKTAMAMEHLVCNEARSSYAMQGSSQRSQGVAGRNALTVDVPVPLRLQKSRYAFDVFILLVFSSVRESIASGSQVHETRRAK